MSTAPDIVFAGNLLVDDVVFTDGRTRMGEAGGAMLYAPLGAALWGARVAIASVAGNDDPAAALEAIAARGVDLAGVRRLAGPGVRTWLLHEGEARRVIHHLDRPSHIAVSPAPADLPRHYLMARAFHLAPMPLECQFALLSGVRMETGAMVSIDPHVPLAEDTFGGWSRTLLHADVLFAGLDEMRLDGAGGERPAALERVAAAGVRLALLKRGELGGVLYDRERRAFTPWRPVTAPVVDPTGAGDAFAGGFLSGLLEHGRIEEGLERGAVSASFAIEAWGAAGLLAATRERAEERREQWFGARKLGSAT